MTLFEILVGYLLACVVGFILSLATVYHFNAFRRGVMPLIVASQTIPVIAIAPILVIWFGYNAVPRIIITSLSRVLSADGEFSSPVCKNHRAGVHQLLPLAKRQ